MENLERVTYIKEFNIYITSLYVQYGKSYWHKCSIMKHSNKKTVIYIYMIFQYFPHENSFHIKRLGIWWRYLRENLLFKKYSYEPIIYF